MSGVANPRGAAMLAPRARKALLGSLVLSSHLFLGAGAAADECAQILSQGVYNSYEWTRGRDLRSTYEREFCRNVSEQEGRGSDTQLGGSYAGFGGTFGRNRSSAYSLADELCDAGSGALSDDGFEQLIRATVAPEIVAAWSACRRSPGPYILGSVNGSTLVVEYKFRPAGNVTTTSVTQAPEITGATCRKPLDVGTELGPGGVYATCARDGNEPITIVLNTTYGGAKFFAPSISEKMAQRPESTSKPKGSNRVARLVTGPGGQRPMVPAGKHLCVVTDAKCLVVMNGREVNPICHVDNPRDACRCPKYSPGPIPTPLPRGYTLSKWLEENGSVERWCTGEVAIFE